PVRHGSPAPPRLDPKPPASMVSPRLLEVGHLSVLVGLVRNRFYYGWIVVGAVFLTLLATSGIRAAPSVLIVPLERAFGWDRATISSAISLNLVLYGLMGPFVASLMQRIGVRVTAAGALVLLVIAIASSAYMTHPWQMVLTWGLMVGIGTGATAIV